jgi:hypothetical protein
MKLDFSQWSSYSAHRQRDELESICGVTSIARMPPPVYVAVHPEAKLGPEEKKAVCAWADVAKQRVK